MSLDDISAGRFAAWAWAPVAAGGTPAVLGAEAPTPASG